MVPMAITAVSMFRATVMMPSAKPLLMPPAWSKTPMVLSRLFCITVMACPTVAGNCSNSVSILPFMRSRAVKMASVVI